MATETEIRDSGRDRCIAAAMEGLQEHWAGGAEAVSIFEEACTAVDALIDQVLLFPAERWDEDCHDCEQMIRDHRVDGRCPDLAEPQSQNPNPGDSS